jgi:signal transduction histidine kinase
MFRVRDYSISKKLTWMNMLVSGTALGLACAAFITYDLVSARETIVRSLSIQGQIVGSNSVSALLFNDRQSAEKTLSALKSAPNVLCAAIYTPEGHLFAAYRRDSRSPTPPLSAQIPERPTNIHGLRDRMIIIASPVVFQGKRVGTVYIRSSLQELFDRLKRYLIIVTAVFLTSLVTAVLMSSLIRRSIADPIVQLAETARIVSREKKYSVRAPTTGNHDELSILVVTFNEMLAQIEKHNAALREAHDELEHRVQERTAQLQDANRQLESFSYSVAHDLRAPLRAISGFSKMLVEDHGSALDGKAQHYLQSIGRGVQTMNNLINDLLEFSRQGLKEMALCDIEMGELVSSVFEELQRATPDRKLEWRLETTLPAVHGDRAMIRQVWVNLLSNAIKFTGAKDNALVKIGCSEEGAQQNTYYIKDNGAGFDMRYAQKLFGIFQRLHSADSFQGTGVGLSIVQRVVQRHGGRVWAEGKVNQGATFHFALPAAEEKQELETFSRAANAKDKLYPASELESGQGTR